MDLGREKTGSRHHVGCRTNAFSLSGPILEGLLLHIELSFIVPIPRFYFGNFYHWLISITLAMGLVNPQRKFDVNRFWKKYFIN